MVSLSSQGDAKRVIPNTLIITLLQSWKKFKINLSQNFSKCFRALALGCKTLRVTHQIHKNKLQRGCLFYCCSCLPFLIIFSYHFCLSSSLIGCLPFLSTFLLSFLSFIKQCLYYFIELYVFLKKKRKKKVVCKNKNQEVR